jgi:membrane protease YdiL (CAAX protease family)
VSGDRAPALFFALVLALTVPFLLLGEVTGTMVLPGLPVSALIVVCPTIAAVALVAARHQSRGLRLFVRGAFGRWPRGWWWVPTLLLFPGTMVVSWIAQRAAGVAVPVPVVGLLDVGGLFALLLVAGAAEELGWSGYAVEPLRDRWGPLAASMVIGAVWVVFHLVPLLQAARSVAWIAWWTLGTLGLRVVLVWLYEHTGRAVIGVSIMHASYNLAWQLYPVRGSFYDPAVTSTVVAAVAVVVALLWRRPPRTRLGAPADVTISVPTGEQPTDHVPAGDGEGRRRP